MFDYLMAYRVYANYTECPRCFSMHLGNKQKERHVMHREVKKKMYSERKARKTTYAGTLR